MVKAFMDGKLPHPPGRCGTIFALLLLLAATACTSSSDLGVPPQPDLDTLDPAAIPSLPLAGLIVMAALLFGTVSLAARWRGYSI